MKPWKAILGVMLPGALFGALAGIYPGYRLYNYTWNDARFCTSCHVHDYATVGWQNSIHGGSTTCHDCHHQPLRAYIHESIVMLKKRPKFPQDLDHTPYVKSTLCGSCHLAEGADLSTLTGPMTPDQVARLPKVDRSLLHQLHLKKKTDFTSLNSHELTEGERSPKPVPPSSYPRTKGPERDISCADCHGGPANRGHNFSASEISCLRCHEQPHPQEKGRRGFAQAYGCRSCHYQDFLAPLPAANHKK